MDNERVVFFFFILYEKYGMIQREIIKFASTAFLPSAMFEKMSDCQDEQCFTSS